MKTNENLKNSQIGNENLNHVKGGQPVIPMVICPDCGSSSMDEVIRTGPREYMCTCGNCKRQFIYSH